MNPLPGSSQHFVKRLFSVELSLIEKCLFAGLVGMLLINSLFVFQGRDIGDHNQIRLAKLRAEQELMAHKDIR